MKIKAGSFKKIKSNANMYCMTVEENHTFVLEENKHRFIVKNCMQNEWAGAQAVNSFDTYMAPFVRLKRLEIIEEYKSLNVSIDAAVEAAVDKKLYKYVKQCMQTLLYGINTPSRWGSQAPFSNVTLDLSIPEDLREKKPFIGGKTCSFTYGDCDKEVDLLNMAFLSVYEEGDFVQSGFQYPIITINVDEEFNWRNEVAEKLFTITSKYGTPYFSNFINTGMTKKDLRSMCCRLRLDLREIRKNVTGGLFGAADNTGSVGVVTINMPRIGFLENTKEHFFARLDRVMTHAKDALEIKRKQLDVWYEGGLYPYTKRYLTAGFKNHFSTIGLVGMNECCQNFLGKDIGTKEGQAFAVEVLEHMRDKLSDFQEETGNLYNLESTPAESTCYRLAKHDKEKYPAIITAGMNNENPYYTNSTNLPVGYTDDPWKAIKHQEKIQKIYSGGTTFHTYLGESVTDWTKTADFIKKVMENTELPYLTISPNYSICETHGYIRGSHTKCPTCEAEQRQAYEEALKKLDIKEAEILAQVDSCCE